MQQGVMETQLYNGYMLKGSIPEQERTLQHQISRAFESSDSKTKKDLYRAHHRMQVGDC